jgi:hypothetical protein
VGSGPAGTGAPEPAGEGAKVAGGLVAALTVVLVPILRLAPIPVSTPDEELGTRSSTRYPAAGGCVLRVRLRAH